MKISPLVREQSGIWWDWGCLSPSSVCTLSHSGDHCSVHCSARQLVAPTFPLVTDNTCTVTPASHQLYPMHRSSCTSSRSRNAFLHSAVPPQPSHLPERHHQLFALSLAIIFSTAPPPRWAFLSANSTKCSGLQLKTLKVPLHCFLILSPKMRKCVRSSLLWFNPRRCWSSCIIYSVYYTV